MYKEESKTAISTEIGTVENSPGFYRELSPQEFNRQKDMVVVLLKADQARSEFADFHTLITISDAHQLKPYLARLPIDQTIGLVCPDGDCSGRLAIRLSNQGFRVYHLGGGLREWYHCCRGVAIGNV